MPESVAATDAASPPPPVYIVPGEGSITILSDDPEALDQVERVLSDLGPPSNTAGRDISIFQLQNASATDVADQLQELFRPGRSYYEYGRSFSRVRIVADERRNTIVVQGSRTERDTIENLIRALDSPELPEAVAANRPTLLPIENTDAQEIAIVVRQTFASQLRPVGQSSALTPQVTADDLTNSLVIKAPAPLREEITALAKQLDEGAVKNPSRQMKIISLKNTNARAVEEALDQILQQRPRYRRSY